jgi:hypothetical protein
MSGDATAYNAPAQAVADYDVSGSGTIAALNGNVAAVTNGCSTVIFSITGTWVGTLSIQCLSADGNWNSLTAYSLTTGQATSTLTANTVLTIPCGGYQSVRLAMTAYTSGTAAIAWNSSAGSNTINIGQTVGPSDVNITGTLTSLSSVVTLPNLNGTSTINIDIGGTWVGTITALAQNPFDSKQLYIQPLLNSVLQQNITTNGNYRLVGFPTSASITIQFTSYTSGTANVNIRASTSVFAVQPISLVAANNLTSAWLSDGSGNAIGSDTATNGNQYLRVSSVQSIITSTNNSTTTNLAAGASFTGTIETTPTEGLIDVLVSADQPCTVQVQQSPDGTNWDIKDTYYTFSNVADARTFDTAATYYRVLITNTGILSTTFLRVQTRLIPQGTATPRALTQYGNMAVALMETSPMGAIAKQLFFDSFDVGLDTTNRWNTPVAAGGGSAATTGTLGYTQLGTGTTANGYSYLQTQAVFKQTSPGFLASMTDINVEFPVINNAYRFWGMANLPATPTAASPITNGIGYEISTTGKMYAVTYSTGTRNVIQDLSTSGNNAQPTDNLAHKYYVFFRGDLAFWAIDELNNVVATMRTGLTGPTANNLPITMLAIAGSSAPSSSGLLTNNGVFLGDTSGANSEIADGTYPWRKLTVDSNGYISTKILDSSGNALNSDGNGAQLMSTKVPRTFSAPTTASVGTTSTLILGANANRKGLYLSNTTAQQISLGFNGNAAGYQLGITLFPGEKFWMDEYSFSTGAIYAITSGTAAYIGIQELT